MARARIDYSSSSGRSARVEGGVDVTTPVAGHYRTKLRSGGVFVGVRIWHGPPLDPDTGEELDRSWRWQAHLNGEYIELDRVWPQCAADPITPEEYKLMCAKAEWAKQHAPASAYTDPRKRIDLLSTANPLPF